MIKNFPKISTLSLAIILCCFFVTLLQSCKKEETIFTPEANLKSDFFKKNVELDNITQRVFDHMQKNLSPTFIDSFSQANGLPIWNSPLLTKKNQTGYSSISATGGVDTLVFLPLIVNGQLTVSGFIKAEINNGITLSYSLAKDFKNYPDDPTPTCPTTKSQFANFVMYLDHFVSGRNGYTITDSTIYPTDKLNPDKYLYFEDDSSFQTGGNVTALATVCITSTVTVYYEQLGCHPRPNVSVSATNCYDVIYDDGTTISGPPVGMVSGGTTIPYVYPCPNGGPVTANCPGPAGNNGWEYTPILHIDENDDDPFIDLQKLINCFNQVPDLGATYSIKLCTDIPIDFFPDAPFNVSGSPGHTFLTLTKTNGSQTVSQSMGFYPTSKSLNSVPGGFKDNGIAGDGHRYNASIIIANASSFSFNTVIQYILAHQNDNYNLAQNNCTNMVVSAFNSIINPPIIMQPFPVILPPATANTVLIVEQSPQGLYQSIKTFNAVGNISKEFKVDKKAPSGSGECN